MIWRLALALMGLCLACGAQAQTYRPGFGFGRPGFQFLSVGGGGGFSTFNPADKSATVTLSNGNLRMTNGGSAGFVRATQTATAGAIRHFEMTVRQTGAPGFGLMTTAVSATSTPNGLGQAFIRWVNEDTTGAANAVSTIIINGVVVNQPAKFDVVGTVLGVDYNPTTGYVCFSRGGTVIFENTSASYQQAGLLPAAGYLFGQDTWDYNPGSSAFTSNPRASAAWN